MLWFVPVSRSAVVQLSACYLRATYAGCLAAPASLHASAHQLSLQPARRAIAIFTIAIFRSKATLVKRPKAIGCLSTRVFVSMATGIGTEPGIHPHGCKECVAFFARSGGQPCPCVTTHHLVVDCWPRRLLARWLRTRSRAPSW
eukprot:scaffold4870_cov106-Isochrysis_galbana.AAC.3